MCHCNGSGVIIHYLTPDEEERLSSGWGGWDGIEYCGCDEGKRQLQERIAFDKAVYGRCGHGPECLCWDTAPDDWLTRYDDES